MTTLQKYLKLKKAAEEKRREADRAGGAYEGAMKRLQEEFGCASIEEARKKLKQMKREAAGLGTEVETKTQEFTEAYGDLL